MTLKSIIILLILGVFNCIIYYLLHKGIIPNYLSSIGEEESVKFSKKELRTAVRAKQLYDAKELSIQEIIEILEIKNKIELFKILKFENNRLGTNLTI